MPDSFADSARGAECEHWHTRVVVVGSGVAGLACALALAPTPVLLLTKTSGPAGGSSVWAQGGIAAPVGPGDTPAEHAADTVAAGAGLVDSDRALLLAREGADAVRDLVMAGVPFDRDADGALTLGREAAHSRHRIVHAGGDSTGRLLIESLLGQVARVPSIRVVPECFVLDLTRNPTQDLTRSEERIDGLVAYTRRHGLVQVHADQVVLATGGVGALWRETTNPAEGTGDGIALAARAGAVLADLEFVQFHPTALLPAERSDGAKLPLLTEALRGAGALLLDAEGHRFMVDEHPLAELAPRDVVARAIARRARDGQVFLDLRPALAAKGAASFPQGLALCRQSGYEPMAEPVPIAPAAHYHMGGVVSDACGRSSVGGLWVCGEVAMTGVHGANRLASNSLLEGLVFGRRVARAIAEESRVVSRAECHTKDATAAGVLPAAVPGAATLADLRNGLRTTMARDVGIERSGPGLVRAAEELNRIQKELRSAEAVSSEPTTSYEAVRGWGELRNMLTTARLIGRAALLREESRGAHSRCDYPEVRAEWQQRLPLTLAELDLATGERPVMVRNVSEKGVSEKDISEEGVS